MNVFRWRTGAARAEAQQRFDDHMDGCAECGEWVEMTPSEYEIGEN